MFLLASYLVNTCAELVTFQNNYLQTLCSFITNRIRECVVIWLHTYGTQIELMITTNQSIHHLKINQSIHAVTFTKFSRGEKSEKQQMPLMCPTYFYFANANFSAQNMSRLLKALFSFRGFTSLYTQLLRWSSFGKLFDMSWRFFTDFLQKRRRLKFSF